MDKSEYIIEREFLNKISTSEMIRNIIITHQENEKNDYSNDI
ncbi:MAG: hypothetical protein ACI4F4_00510 [Lachnospiraceae bacterium]